jgi:hypothetical protein
VETTRVSVVNSNAEQGQEPAARLLATAGRHLCCLPHINVDCSGFEVETLINVRIAKAGLMVAEVPSFEECRIHGQSNLNTFRDGFRVLRTLWRERRRGPLALTIATETNAPC